MNLSDIIKDSNGGIPINGTLPFNSVESTVSNVYTTWLKSGEVSSSVLYPLATHTPIVLNQTEIVPVTPIDVHSFIEIGSFYYVLSAMSTNIIAQTDKNFTPTGTTYTLTHSIESFVYDTDLGVVWCIENGASNIDNIHKYDTSFVFQNVSRQHTDLFSFSGSLPGFCATYNAGFFWVTTLDSRVLKYDSDWAYVTAISSSLSDAITTVDGEVLLTNRSTGDDFRIGYERIDVNTNILTTGDFMFPIVNDREATYDNGYYYKADYNGRTVYRFDLAGRYTGWSFDTVGYIIDLTIRQGVFYILTKPDVDYLSGSAGSSVDVYSASGVFVESFTLTVTIPRQSLFIAYDSTRDVFILEVNGFVSTFGLDFIEITPTLIPIDSYANNHGSPRQAYIKDGFIYTFSEVYSASERRMIKQYNLSDYTSTGATFPSSVFLNYGSSGNYILNTTQGTFLISPNSYSLSSLLMLEDTGVVGLITATTDPTTSLPIYTRIR